MDFLTFRSQALQALSLEGMKIPNHWCKDDVERWVKEEYQRHYGKEKECDCCPLCRE